ncbi:hypothetical protein L596_001488 [Steinernema carpocapsae]|uniref:Uncharacterized protein n=1 Tax=Steinernema carpocapsae TaxID=34508 RepID=A0A4U8ULX6_STECR|nr:hypothetical protein L596_001488 [Steinernema carpocapsae]
MRFSSVWTDITTCIDGKQTCPLISAYNRPIHRSRSLLNDVVPSLYTCSWFLNISINPWKTPLIKYALTNLINLDVTTCQQHFSEKSFNDPAEVWLLHGNSRK